MNKLILSTFAVVALCCLAFQVSADEMSFGEEAVAEFGNAMDKNEETGFPIMKETDNTMAIDAEQDMAEKAAGGKRKPAAKKTVRKPAAKKTVRKPAAKKTVRKPAAKKTVRKPAAKKTVRKPAAKKTAGKKTPAKRN